MDAGGVYFCASVSNCTYATINDCLEKFDFESAFSVNYGADGNVVSVLSDASRINAISAFLANECYDCLDRLICDGYYVPAGAFSGIKLLAGFGPELNVKLISVLSVQCDVVREFVSAGINQTRMTLSLIVNCDITVYSVFEKKSYNGKIDAVVLDCMIVGKVPQVYLGKAVIAKTEKE